MRSSDHCKCGGCMEQVIDSIQQTARDRAGLELRILQLEHVIENLTNHIDTWTHSNHKSYHGGPDGYFYCSMPSCVASATLVRQIENH